MDEQNTGNMDSVQLFTHELDTVMRSGEGVVFVATPEPDRAIEAINDLVSSYENIGDGLALWKMTSGITMYDTEQEKAAAKEPRAALEIFAGASKDNSALSNVNYMVMNWVHYFTAKLPPLVQGLVDYSVELPHQGEHALGKRLICIVPATWVADAGLEELPIVNLRRPHLSELETSLRDILENSISDQAKIPQYNDSQLTTIANNAGGMTIKEAEGAFSSVIYQNISTFPEYDYSSFATEVATLKAKSVDKSPVLSMEKTALLSEIGGLEVLKTDMHIMASCTTPEAKLLNIDSPKGIFLAGAPGTGKSLMAKAVAAIMEVPLIQFNVSRVFGGLVGSSEKNMSEALDIISATAPCIVLVDEIDKVFTQGGGNDSGTSDRVLGALLTHMQNNDKGVFWVFTANRTQGLPAELLRKGRLDELYGVSLPTSVERDAVLRIHLEKRGVAIPKDLSKAVVASKGYVPAELESAVVDSMRKCFTDNQTVGVTSEYLLQSLSQIKPLSLVFAEQFADMEEWAVNHARSASVENPVIIDELASVRPKRTRKIPVQH